MTNKIKAGLAITLSVIVVLLVIRTGPVKRQLYRSATIRGIAEGVREDLKTFRTLRYKNRSKNKFDEYVSNHSIRKLQIGAGSSRLEGWLNTDIIEEPGLAYLDATQPFPLPDHSFHRIFSEHVIEHLSYEDGRKMLHESARILVPGGKVRIATPNLLQFVRLFQNPKTVEMTNYIPGKLAWHQWPTHPLAESFILNLQLSQFGHKFVYDPETLKSAISESGFTSIKEVRPSESDDPEFRDIERREGLEIKRLNEYETMIFEASKPE
jgi:predicted SAM-dependent methyltransferase